MHDSPGTASYSLKLSERERMRYRVMAANAADNEAAEWPAAGIAPGARMADVGCGPGAVLRLLAERVGAEGRAIGIDADPSAVFMAQQEVAGLLQARVQVGQADATAVMCWRTTAGGRQRSLPISLPWPPPAAVCIW